MNPISKIAGLVVTIAQLAGTSALLGQQLPTPVPANANAPHIQFSETTFDFGKVTPTDTLKHEFIVTNTGNAVLEITDVKPGCGCTTAGAWDKLVQPGKTGKIPIQFNPGNFSGSVSKSVTVTCNDPVKPTQYLQILANIWRPIDLQPQYVYFLPIEGEVTNETRVVRIVSNLDEAVTLEAPQSASPVFKTELKTIRPGKEFELQVIYAGPVSNANMQGNITIKTSSTNAPSLSLNAVAMPQPALVAMPPQIQLPAGPFAAGYQYPASLRNKGSAPLKLSEPSVNAEGVTVQVQETEPGKNFQLNVAFPTNFQARPGQLIELSVKTSNPKYPVFKIPITQAFPATPVAGAVTPVPDSK